MLDACNDSDDCEWADNSAVYMTTRRWYPTLETLEDGSAIVVRPLPFLSPLVFVAHAFCLGGGLDRRLPVGRLRQRPVPVQPDVRVLPFQGRSRNAQRAPQVAPRQPLLAHLAPPFRSVSIWPWPLALSFLPLSLTFPLSCSGNLFIQTNWNTEIFDYKQNIECELLSPPGAIRTKRSLLLMFSQTRSTTSRSPSARTRPLALRPCSP